MTEFTTRVSSGGIINIPQHVEDMNEFEKDDLLTLKVVKHKKQNGEVVTVDEEADHQVVEE